MVGALLAPGDANVSVEGGEKKEKKSIGRNLSAAPKTSRLILKKGQEPGVFGNGTTIGLGKGTAHKL